MNQRILIARACEAWDADDGQSSAEDIAARVVDRAVASGSVNRSDAALAIRLVVAHLEQPVAGTADQQAAQAAVDARYAAEDAAKAASAAAAAAWLTIVESSRREVHWEICPHTNAWVPSMEQAIDENGEVIATRHMLPTEGWTPWRAVRRPVAVEAIVSSTPSAPATPSAADTEADAFVAALPTMSAEAAKATYWSLSSLARNSAAIRALPKAVRRQF